MKEFFNTTHARKVFLDLSTLKTKDQLETKLTSIAIKGGLDYDQAHQAAKDILEVFQTHETVLQDFSSDSDLPLDRFLNILDSHYNSEAILGHLYTSLKLMDDPVNRDRLLSDPFSEEMTQLWVAHHSYVRKHYEQAREEVRNTIRRFNLPKEDMKKLLEDLDYFGVEPERHAVFKAEYLREHMARSAITSMYLYLDNRKKLLPHQAALTTCTIEDAAAFHEAIIAGQEQMAAVKDALWAWAVLHIALAVLVLLCGVVCYEEFIHLLILAAILVVVGGVPALLSHPIGALLGVAKVKVNNENRNQALNQAEESAFVDPTGLFNAQNYPAWDEMTDNALVY